MANRILAKTKELGMRKPGVIKSIIILLFCLGIEVAIAKEITWKLAGDTLRISETYGSSTTVWRFQGDSAINGGPKISSLAWSRNENSWRITNDYHCMAQGEQGIEYTNDDQFARLIWEFADGSTLLLKFRNEISCSVVIPDGMPANSQNNFGSWKLYWDITGGSGKYAGATGRVEGTGDWTRNWRDLHSRSVSYEGQYTLYLD